MFSSSDSGGSHFNSGSFFHATHPNNQQDSHWGGYSPSPLSPGVPMPLPEDPCTDSNTPHLQRLPQGTYMQLMQENQQMLALREHCKVLELQIVKLTSERDTLKSMFQQLTSTIQLPPTDSGLKLDSIIPPVQPVAKRPTRLTHPYVQFWTNEDFTAWLDSPDSLRANRGKVPYLEDKNGDPLTDTIIKAIWKLLRGAWAELIRRKLAPKTWGKASATARQVVHTLMENTYPLFKFKFADGGWKLDYLISTSYSAWRQNHVDDYGNWKKKNIDDEDEDEDEESSGCSSNAKGKKLDPICKHVLLSPSPSLTPSRAPSPISPLAPPSPTILPLKSLNLLDAPSPKSPDTAASPKSVQIWPTTTEKQSIPPPVPSTTVAVPMEKENIPPPPVAAPSIALIVPQPIIKINITNPLSTLTLAAVGTMIPPLPPSIDPPPSLSAPCSTAIKGPSEAGDATNGRGSKISKGKMCPTQTKNGWDLSADQHKQYDNEAAELVANNAWDKKVYEGTLH
ncbi:hypothetical protein F4604DRAFT_1973491 [Suillus subluteus]|nr:hypothetical protein F4604DRAFT_1973491 [Suillus subluteus]